MEHAHIKEPSLLYIAGFVVAIHLALLFWFSFSAESFVKPKQSQRLIVKTVSLQPKISKPIEPSVEKQPEKISSLPSPPSPLPKKIEPKKTSVPTPQVKPQPQPKAKPKPTPKKITPKKEESAAKTTPPSSPPPAPKKTPSPQNTKQKELIAKAQESIAKIQKTSDKVSTGKMSSIANLSIPQLKSKPISNGGMNETETDYRDELAARLKLLLRLPEYGDVQVKLTLDRSGSFIKMVIIKAESEINGKYLEKTLPGLTFPGFGDNFKGASSYTFSITLSNDVK